MTWGSAVERERHRRIKLSVAAFAYERLSVSLISDAEFDRLCLEVDLSIDTGNERMDKWWRENFDPSTGMWVARHPEQPRLEQLALMMMEMKGLSFPD